MALFKVDNKKDAMKGSMKYSRNIQIPQYEPSENKPHIMSLVNVEKYGQLIYEINQSNVSDEEKEFLRKAATRHLVFNYDLIADYYVNASEEMQGLMEKSALVLIDFDDALANGYVKFSNRIKEIRKYAKSQKDL